TCLTNLGVPSTALYASTMETSMHEEKIFEEIAIGFLKVFAHIEAIRKILNIEQNNFEIIRSANLLHQEIQYEVISKKNRKDTIIEEMAKMISTIKDDIYHEGLNSKNKKNALEKWEDNKTNVMIATTAFGMGLNIPNVRLILHHTFPMTLVELIQLSGRAGHNGQLAKS
ncbi:8998_t:CDS:2, partial [Gigaspora rosea]